MEIIPNIHMFLGRNSPLEANSYLILGDEKILVDTGVPVEKLEKEFSILNLKLSDIDIIVNTHCHFDHIRFNRILQEKSAAKIAAHFLDAPNISSLEPAYTGLQFINEKIMPAKVGINLKEGDRLGNFEVMHTPGHTQGSICLYNLDDAILISGDLIFASSFTGRVDLPGGNKSDLIKSLRKLFPIPVEKILPGHGWPVLKDGNNTILDAIGLLKSDTLST